MAHIFIPTFVSDIHAVVVDLALQQQGHQVTRWFGADFPEISSIAVQPSAFGRSSLRLSNDSMPLMLDQVDIFWNRRHVTPVRLQELHPADVEVAETESKFFSRAFFSALSDHCFSVNHIDHARIAENKLGQLIRAKACGWEIPATLIANDPQAMHAFIAEHSKTGVISKPHRPAIWKADDGQIAITFTNTVQLADLPSAPVLQAVPNILQEKVPKAYELRITCMGHHVQAVKLDSQAAQDTQQDWRGGSPTELKIQAYELPESITRQCLDLLKKLNLLFACIDVIVTPDGRYVFLEVNQMGQFLWIEEVNPEIALLDMFCQFLLSRDPQFQYVPGSSKLSHPALLSQAIAQSRIDEQSHRFHRTMPQVYEE